jgi:hypothetical protein
VDENLDSWMAMAAIAAAVLVVIFIGWAPAPEGFVAAAAAALAWCRWAEAHPIV